MSETIPNWQLMKIVEYYIQSEELNQKNSYAKNLIIEKQKKHFDLFNELGYSNEETQNILDLNFYSFLNYTLDTKNSDELVDKMVRYSALDGIDAIIWPRYTIPLLEINQHDFDFEKAMDITLSKSDLLLRAKYVLRYHDLLKDKISKRKYEKLVDRMLEKSNMYLASDLSTYYDVIQNEFPKKENRSFEILNFRGALLPLISFVNSDSLSKNNNSELKKWIYDSPVYKSDSIKSVKAIHKSAGSCTILESKHNNSLFNKSDNTYGNVVKIKVKGNLVATMKLNGDTYYDKSLMGVAHVEDENGLHPIVVGGIYSTTPDVLKKAIQKSKEQGPWAELNLDHLTVKPLRFYRTNNVTDFHNFAEKIVDLGETVLK